MPLTRSSRRFGSWLAIVAMAFNVLWPLLAHAKPARNSASIMQICTANGTKWLAADRGEQHPAQKNLVPQGAFCSLGADRAPLPSFPAILPERASIIVALIVRSKTARVVSRSIFSTALPRAPPILS